MSDIDKPVVEYENDRWKVLTGDEDAVVEFMTEDEREAAEVEAKKTPPADELMERINRLTAEKEALAARADEVSGLREGLEQLGTRLQAPAESRPAPVPFDAEKENERLREEIQDRPLDALRRVLPGLVGSDIMTLAEQVKELRGLVMTIDPKWGDVYSKYKGEVDAAVAKRQDRYSNTINAFTEETERVAARHITEIVAEQVKKQLEEQQAASRGRGPNGQFTEVGRSNNPPTRPTKRFVITEADERERLGMGLDRETYYAAKERREKRNGR